MTIMSLILLLLSNSITLRQDKSILYSRATITILIVSIFISYDNLNFLFLNKGIGIFGGLFHSTAITAVFQIFILSISSVILLLTSFYPRKVWLKEYSSMDRLLFTKLIYYQTILLNKMGEQFKIIEYSLIILFIVIGSIFLISTSDLVSIFLSIELQSYGLYLLSTIYRDSEPATFGGLMYFLLGGLSSCFILLSTSLLYANSGTTNLDSLYIITSISNVSGDNISGLLYWYKAYYIHVSLLFMSVGFLFKVSAAPFHFWSPDVYDAIPTIVTTFVAIISKISIFIFLLELVHYTSKSLFDMNFSWTISLLFSSLLSLVIGTVVGLTQSRIKRLYAFSTISHVGFILLGLSIHTVESTQAFMFYLIQYSISNLNAFMLIIAIGYSLYSFVYKATYINTGNDEQETEKTHGNDNIQDINNSPIQLIDQLKGYYFINPVLSLSLAITLFSFAGIPPLIGFFGKQMILSAAIDNGYIFMALIAILTSVISAVYYLAIIKQIFFDKPDYTLNTELTNFNADGLITDKTIILKKVSIKINNIVLSSYLSLSISVITLIISLFIYIPESFINTVNLLSLIIFNL
jgi:NADH-ubiquinone oxidoreductase chain 2